MLHLPTEILEMILHHVLFPVNCMGYYLYSQSDPNCPWAQQDGLNLSATCRRLRRIFIPILWQHVRLDIFAHRPNTLPNGFKLIPDAVRPDSKLDIPFLNCSWIEKTDNCYSEDFDYYGHDIFNSMDHVL